MINESSETFSKWDFHTEKYRKIYKEKLFTKDLSFFATNSIATEYKMALKMSFKDDRTNS
jgi:hypothetical protein